MKTRKVIETELAPMPIGSYSQAIMANGFLFISGQVAINPATNLLVIDTVEAETEMVMSNLQAILHKAGLSFEDVVKTTIFLSDMLLFTQVNQVYSQYFKTNFPARETVAVKGLPKGVNVEISMIAAVNA